jgi:hypothetical protein
MGRLLLCLAAACIASPLHFATPAAAQVSAAEPHSEVAAADYPPLALTPEQARADVALLRRALETIHPGLYRYRTHVEIDAAFARLKSAADRPTTDIQLWRAIAVMLAEIHCDHTKPEVSTAIDRFRASHPTLFPLRFTFVEGRMIVVSGDGQPGAPPRGAEIVGINGVPAPVAVSLLATAVAYDGRKEASILAKLSADGDLTGDDFNEYWPAFYGFPQQWRLDWKAPGDLRLSHATLAPVSFERWTELPWPGGVYRDEFYNSIQWRLEGKKAFLRIDTFVNYRNPVDATAFLDGFFKTLKARGVTDLILDLRANGGGSEDVSVALGRYLLPSTFVWSKPVLLKAVRYGDLPAHMESWGDPTALFDPPLDHFTHLADGWWERHPGADPDDDDESVLPQTVSPDRFAGRLTILTGPRNGSGSTRTIAQFKEKLGATLVGEDSSGSAEGPTAGHIFLLTLPNSGLKVRIPNAWNRTNIEHFRPGLGVRVDSLVTPTLADFHAGLDRAFEVAKGAPTPPPPSLGAAFAGNWRGTLDYRDFGNDRRVILPTTAIGSPLDDGATLDFTFDDGPGKTVRSREHWRLAADGKVLTSGAGPDVEAMTIVERRGGPRAGDLTLVAEGHGQENGLPVAVRTIVTRRADRLSISRLTQRPGQPYLLRHGYEFSRMD